jgi:hypothetical protein
VVSARGAPRGLRPTRDRFLQLPRLLGLHAPRDAGAQDRAPRPAGSAAPGSSSSTCRRVPAPRAEQIGASGIFDLLARFQDLDIDRMRGRRNFPLNRWDVVSLRDRVVRLMYEPLIFIVGEEMWLRIRDFYTEAVRWCETRPQVAVHGDFTEENILVDYDGRPHLVDFERVGLGSPEHDFTLLWIHSQRSKEWKRDFFARFVEQVRLRSGADGLVDARDGRLPGMPPTALRLLDARRSGRAPRQESRAPEGGSGGWRGVLPRLTERRRTRIATEARPASATFAKQTARSQDFTPGGQWCPPSRCQGQRGRGEMKSRAWLVLLAAVAICLTGCQARVGQFHAETEQLKITWSSGSLDAESGSVQIPGLRDGRERCLPRAPGHRDRRRAGRRRHALRATGQAEALALPQLEHGPGRACEGQERRHAAHLRVRLQHGREDPPRHATSR